MFDGGVLGCQVVSVLCLMHTNCNTNVVCPPQSGLVFVGNGRRQNSVFFMGLDYHLSNDPVQPSKDAGKTELNLHEKNTVLSATIPYKNEA